MNFLLRQSLPTYRDVGLFIKDGKGNKEVHANQICTLCVLQINEK